ncbi:hypothetical protein EDB81DRAFT_883933 [Dactylonectria macrodidyma]|uniref:Uncharacterized protein n=1 Tax=Dactylonectria macrodidyma TaxID=307937 RepID=A0A9P9EWY8_9HYPO|nr:hypothetical protein EDB81DRAFT_883933 [Dactylonectria macrodidyma]
MVARNSHICTLASLTYLFVLWNFQCRIYASFCRIEAGKGDKFNPETYESHATSFRTRVQKMKNELNKRTEGLKQLYANLKLDRINQATYVGENNKAIVRKRKEEEFQMYKNELTGHATRAIANDLAVVDQWADIVREAELLLRPAAPRVPPTVARYLETEKSKVNKYLEDARWVAYAYAVGTEADEDSPPSPWTAWLELKTNENGQTLLPVLTLLDSNQVVETRRTIHRRKCIDVTPTSERPEETAPGQYLEE